MWIMVQSQHSIQVMRRMLFKVFSGLVINKVVQTCRKDSDTSRAPQKIICNSRKGMYVEVLTIERGSKRYGEKLCIFAYTFE